MAFTEYRQGWEKGYRTKLAMKDHQVACNPAHRQLVGVVGPQERLQSSGIRREYLEEGGA